MTPEEAQTILDEQGVNALICVAYPAADPMRITLLRINHAVDSIDRESATLAGWLAGFILNPTEYLADELLLDSVRELARRLHVLEGELLKSLPALSRKETTRAEGLRQPDRPATREGEGPAPPDPRDDWGDVPF